MQVSLSPGGSGLGSLMKEHRRRWEDNQKRAVSRPAQWGRGPGLADRAVSQASLLPIKLPCWAVSVHVAR